MRHPKAEEWEAKLKGIFDRIDAELEQRYGGLYPLHPARPSHGTAENPEADGLFDVGAAFTAGFGSESGPGYVIQVRMATLADVPAEVQKRIRAEVVERLAEELRVVFAGRDLRVVDEGNVFKIVGDLKLGNA